MLGSEQKNGTEDECNGDGCMERLWRIK